MQGIYVKNLSVTAPGAERGVSSAQGKAAKRKAGQDEPGKRPPDWPSPDDPSPFRRSPARPQPEPQTPEIEAAPDTAAPEILHAPEAAAKKPHSAANVTAARRILDDISLSIDPGEVYCLLGTDRAKSLLLRLVGVGHSGSAVYVDDANVVFDVPITEEACYIAQAENPWDWMTVYGYAKYSLAAYALRQSDLDRLDNALLLAGLSKKASHKLKYLTATEKKLLEAALEICRGKTKLIINADELVYTPRQYNELELALKNFKAAGKTVLIGLRDARLAGAEMTKVGIMRDGKIIMSGDRQAVSAALKKRCYTIRPTGNLKGIAESIKSLGRNYDVKIKNGRIYVYTDGDTLPKDLVKAVADSGEGLERLSMKVAGMAESLKKVE